MARPTITPFTLALLLVVSSSFVDSFSLDCRGVVNSRITHKQQVGPQKNVALADNDNGHPRCMGLARTNALATAIYSSSSSTTDADVTDDATFDWKEIAKETFSTDKRPVILFDGVCNLCNGGVNFALDNDSVGEFRFASLQSQIGKSLLIRSGKEENDISSIVLVTADTAYFKSDAVLRIAQKLDGSVALPIAGTVGQFVPNFVRNKVYDLVANNRYRFGEADSCRVDGEEFDNRFVSDPEL